MVPGGERSDRVLFKGIELISRLTKKFRHKVSLTGFTPLLWAFTSFFWGSPEAQNLCPSKQAAPLPTLWQEVFAYQHPQPETINFARISFNCCRQVLISGAAGCRQACVFITKFLVSLYFCKKKRHLCSFFTCLVTSCQIIYLSVAISSVFTNSSVFSCIFC